MDSESPVQTMTTVIRNIYRRRSLIRILSTAIFCFLATQFYLSTTTTTTAPSLADSRDNWELEIDDPLVQSYSTVFQDLIDDGFLTVDSRTLAIGTQFLELTAALKGIGVWNSKSTKKNVLLPYRNDSFDFEFSSHTGIDCSSSVGDFAVELSRVLKPDGFLVIHTQSKDVYSLNSLLELFDSFKLVRSREVTMQHWSIPRVRELVLKKQSWVRRRRRRNIAGICSVPAYKQKLIRDSEPLMLEEPMNPKQNRKNVKYLTTMADIRFKSRYVYIDVGARSYGSSIGGWFKRFYPKQDKLFNIFAVEADKRFHEEYKWKKKVTLVPYAAWVRNESLFFEINRVANKYDDEERGRGRGMGRVQSAHTSTSFMGDMNKIQGFDFADWVKNSFTEKDLVVVKMDVEGTEFDLVPKMVESGAICLIDEMFLECHYDPKQRCDGERSSKYEKGYEDCLELYKSLRDKGVLVHQW